MIALVALVPMADFGEQWSIAVAVVAALLVAEHILARPDRPGSLHVAFFHVNSWVGPVVLAGILGELWW